MLEWIRDERHRTGWRVLCAGLTLAVLWLALAPQPPREFDTGWDKANHLLAFAAMTATAWRGWAHDAAGRRAGAAVIATQCALGVLIELLQSQVPGRSADAQDLVADALGIALGALLAWRLLRRRAAPPA